jgi:two-component system response regulator YesN
MKRDFLRKTIYQTTYNEHEWYEQAYSIGLKLKSMSFIPALCFNRVTKESFISEDTILFSIQSVIGEILQEHSNNSVHFPLDNRESFLFFPYSPTVKSDCYGIATDCMKKIQRTLLNTLNISVSFLIGDVCEKQEVLTSELTTLLKNTNHRFYMKLCSIDKKRFITNSNENIFSWYDDASVEIRQLIIEKDVNKVVPTVTRWVNISGKTIFFRNSQELGAQAFIRC